MKELSDKSMTISELSSKIYFKLQKESHLVQYDVERVLNTMVDMAAKEIADKNSKFDLDSEIEFCIWDSVREKAEKMSKQSLRRTEL